MNMVSEKIASILFYMSSPLSIFLHCGVGATKKIGYLTDYCVCMIFIFAYIYFMWIVQFRTVSIHSTYAHEACIWLTGQWFKQQIITGFKSLRCYQSDWNRQRSIEKWSISFKIPLSYSNRGSSSKSSNSVLAWGFLSSFILYTNRNGTQNSHIFFKRLTHSRQVDWNALYHNMSNWLNNVRK